MTRLMYDSITATDIPTSARMVAGYAAADPSFAWSPAAWARFPNAVKVVIATRASITGLGIHVLDVETGDATPAEAPGWANTQRVLGQEPTIYCNASTWQQVIAAFGAAHVEQPNYWIAAYPGGGPVVPAGAIAHQYADPGTSGGHYDLSVVADYWPGVDPPPPTPPAPAGSETMGMIPLTVDNQAGRAHTVITCGSNSALVAEAWLSAASLWGQGHPISALLTCLGDAGQVLKQTTVNLAWNHREPVQLPDGTGIVTLGWTPPATGELVDAIIEFKEK